MIDLDGNPIPDDHCTIHFDTLDTEADPCPLCAGGVR